MASGGGRGRRPRTFRTTCCRRRARARVCAADLPHHVPAGLHGFYWGSEAEASPGPRAGAGRATNRARPGGGRCYKLWTRLGPSLGCLTRPGPAAASLSCMNVGSCSPRAPRPPLLLDRQLHIYFCIYIYIHPSIHPFIYITGSGRPWRLSPRLYIDIYHYINIYIANKHRIWKSLAFVPEAVY